MFPANEFQKYATQHMGINTMVMHDYVNHFNDNMLGMTPNIVEERKMNAAILDVFSRLMMDRIIFLGTGIDDYVANIVTAQLLFLQSTDASKDIYMYINSPGGSVYAGLGIYDTMQIISPDVSTICTGIAASMGAVLQCAGTKGKRSALYHSRIMIHQPSGGARGQASEIEIVHNEIQKLKKELYDIIAFHTGQSYEKVLQDSDRDHWLRAEEAKEYGLIDEVLVSKTKGIYSQNKDKAAE